MSKWIQTFTGKKFDLENPTIDMIDINDIAHHLALECRFGGAVKFPYSVGYHSLLASKFAPKGLELELLFHDAHETYIKDLMNPLKLLIGKVDQVYKVTASKIDLLLKEKFCLNIDQYDEEVIKDIDLRLLVTERKQLLKPPPELWHSDVEAKEPFDVAIVEIGWREIEKQFLVTYDEFRRD